MPENPPEMRPLPRFMLEEGDWVWHPGHESTIANPEGEFLVALERSSAEAWNTARRYKRMS